MKKTKTMLKKSDIQILNSPSKQQKTHIFRDILEYMLVIIVSLTAIFSALISFSDQLKMYF